MPVLNKMTFFIFILLFQRMFKFCCNVNVSSDEEKIQRSHQNPMIRKLGIKKQRNARTNSQIVHAQIIHNQTSFIKQCDISALNQTLNDNSATKTNLTQSILLPLPQTIIQNRNPPRNGPSKENSAIVSNFQKVKHPTETSHKFDNIQDRYIAILEKTNIYLEKQLEKSRAMGQSTIKVQSSRTRSANGKLSSELLQLKDRLNRIDLSGVKKIAKFDLREQKQINPSSHNKQNVSYSTFRELRAKIN